MTHPPLSRRRAVCSTARAELEPFDPTTQNRTTAAALAPERGRHDVQGRRAPPEGCCGRALHSAPGERWSGRRSFVTEDPDERSPEMSKKHQNRLALGPSSRSVGRINLIKYGRLKKRMECESCDLSSSYSTLRCYYAGYFQ